MNAQMNLDRCRVIMQLIVDTHYDPNVYGQHLRRMDVETVEQFVLGSIQLTGGFLHTCAPGTDQFSLTQMAELPEGVPDEVQRAFRNAAMAISASANDETTDAETIVHAARAADPRGVLLVHLLHAVVQTLHGLEHMFQRRPAFRGL